eukprot:Seg9701.2 transcript_id=Seg9701.2/GoldUCD/mRNA.D3Y31 product="hypothetical protein" protein_id=Seg9701.2/GoldUCD/D3Y31
MKSGELVFEKEKLEFELDEVRVEIQSKDGAISEYINHIASLKESIENNNSQNLDLKQRLADQENKSVELISEKKNLECELDEFRVEIPSKNNAISEHSNCISNLRETTREKECQMVIAAEEMLEQTERMAAMSKEHASQVENLEKQLRRANRSVSLLDSNARDF